MDSKNTGSKNCISKDPLLYKHSSFKKIQMYTKENQVLKARPGRLMYAVPESRVFILWWRGLLKDLIKAQWSKICILDRAFGWKKKKSYPKGGAGPEG